MIKIKMESILSPSPQIRTNKKLNVISNSLQCYELGKRYPDFDMLEPFIEEYNVDPTTLQQGDIIIRDWQFGHLPNTGYRPVIIKEPFNGISITVESSFGRLHRVCVDPSLMKDKTFHKLNPDGLKTEYIFGEE